MFFRIFIICVLLFSCTKKTDYIKPSYINFNIKKDSIFVVLKNPVISSSFLKIENLTSKKISYVDFEAPDTVTLLKFHKSEIDTALIDKRYRFQLQYGNSYNKPYDTLYNYNLPFSKGKRYKILQGNNGSFSHRKKTSRYAIDFKMNIGQEVCAIRDGLVIQTKNDYNEGGNSEKYIKKANKIFVYHKDGTYAQYAHFKQNGVLVKVGDSIKKGQLIGYSGNTGFSSEPHLHFVVYKSSKNGLVSIPFILDSIPSKRYKRGKYALNN